MAKKNQSKKNKSLTKRIVEIFKFSLPEKIKRYVLGLTFFLFAIIFILSFFGKAGEVGRIVFKASSFLIGGTTFIIPLFLVFSGFAFFKSEYKEILKPLILAIFFSVLGICGLLGGLLGGGGWLGTALFSPLLKLFGFWVAQIISLTGVVVGSLIFRHLLKQSGPESSSFEKKSDKKVLRQVPIDKLYKEKGVSILTKIFNPSFKVKQLEPVLVEVEKEENTPSGGKKEVSLKKNKKSAFYPSFNKEYKLPPFDLLDSSKGKPTPGDIRTNSEVIKNTLQSFEIPVEMSGVNVGPTVTQYSLKPANGIKLSKITSLSNDLALALATHPIRIEAPIPGQSLVGIEVPNKVRSFVGLKELIQNSKFQDSPSNLIFCLGKDVSGSSIYADLGRMPHLLVAGATGSGKTIFLNNLVLSLIYRNSPDNLRLILIDPKRVEFTVYRDLPHLLCPPIVESAKAVNALKWLIEEMERRFKLLAELGSRNIRSYNEKAFKNEVEILPCIVLVIDELADLMAAKGREVEGSIVRLAQMARAVGIHLVVATQRPSVEVITGLIKANITSRITFQVASQVDSRTVLDISGAEKLLGSGDMLFISSDIIKPKRIQSAYASEKEVKKVVDWIKSEMGEPEELKEELRASLFEALERNIEGGQAAGSEDSSLVEDPLYEQAKEVIVRYRKASSSLLQRKLRIGYARAARLIDTLENKRIIGPSQGAKPREVYLSNQEGNPGGIEDKEDEDEDNDDGWERI
jgi:S-DNA-T family DNA segregation ATPase FtsK/SpoIIIE